MKIEVVRSSHNNLCYSIDCHVTGIDFEEFLEMYQRLFLLCRTVVSGELGDVPPTTAKKMKDFPASAPSKVEMSLVVLINSINSS